MSSATETAGPFRSLRVGDLSSRPLLDIPPVKGGWTGAFDASLTYMQLVKDLLETLTANPAYGAGLRAWAEEKQRAEVKSFVSREAAKHECISVVVADWEEDTVDLLFVVEGDLYDGESAILPIMRRLRSTFRDVAFDVMVLPASAYDSRFRWGTASELVYHR